MVQNYTELEHYIKYELIFWKFKVWVCFGKKEAIENKISERVYISLFYKTKKRKYQKGYTLLK